MRQFPLNPSHFGQFNDPYLKFDHALIPTPPALRERTLCTIFFCVGERGGLIDHYNTNMQVDNYCPLGRNQCKSIELD